MTKTKTATDADLKWMREIFARPLPENDAERHAAPDVLSEKIDALELFQSMLETDNGAIAQKDMKSAIGCTTQIIASNFLLGNTDKKDMVFLYIALLKARPEAVPPKSLDIVFNVIRICAEEANYEKWAGCEDDLQTVLKNLHHSINQSGFTPAGIDAETSPSLGALIFKSLMHEVAEDANHRAMRDYVKLVAIDDARIDAENLAIVSNVIDRETEQSNFVDDDYGRKIWNGLAEKFSTALETSRWKPAVINPTRALENLTAIVEDETLTDRQILPVALRMLKIVDAHVGVDGEFRYQRIPEQTLEAAHDALLTRMWSEPISDLAEKLWRRVNFGSARQLVA